jgi:hypothetical protein
MVGRGLRRQSYDLNLATAELRRHHRLGRKVEWNAKDVGILDLK